MFRFIDNRVYKKIYINFSIIFFIIIISLSILAYRQVHANKYEYIEQNNRQVSQYIETTIRTKQESQVQNSV